MMKKLLIEIAVFAVLIAAVIALAFSLKKSVDNANRLKSDYYNELMHEYSVQQQVTRKELKKYFANEVEKLNQFGVKPGQVENIVTFEYRYIDSVRYRDTLVWVYDTLKKDRCAPFDVSAECYTVSGEIVGDTLEIERVSVHDDILVSLYKEKRKCLFEKRRVKAIAISGCSGDTLSITRNLKIGK